MRASGSSNACWSLRTCVALRPCWSLSTSSTRHALRACLAGIALRPCRSVVSLHACWALRSLRTRGTNSTSHAGWPLRADAASVAFGSGCSGRTNWTRWTLHASSTSNALRTSNASHALRSLRSSKANLRPRSEITSKPPELAVTQRQNEHPRLSPQLRYSVTLCQVGDAAVPAFAVTCLVRSVRVRRRERHDRSQYVGASDLRHETTRLTVPVIGYVER